MIQAWVNAHLQYERDYSLAVRILDRVETTPGYYPGMQVNIIQNDGYNTYDGTTKNILAEFIPNMEQRGYGVMATSEGIRNFMNEFIHARVEIRDGGVNAEIGLEAFPSLNCIKILDGQLYFRLT